MGVGLGLLPVDTAEDGNAFKRGGLDIPFCPLAHAQLLCACSAKRELHSPFEGYGVIVCAVCAPMVARIIG